MRCARAVLAGGLLSACATPPPAFDDVARASVEAAVDSATRAFEASERARDVDAMLRHLAPDFTMVTDGVRSGYDDVVSQVRSTMPTLRSFESEWSDMVVRALGPDAGLSSFHFVDVVVTGEGDTLRAQGPTTLVWERRGEDWRIVYADADHYPAEEPGGVPPSP